jgi:DNA primase
MKGNWVEFSAVKAAVSMQLALDHYKVNWLRKNRNELRGRCPIHKGDGVDAFHVNVEKNCFQCFSCQAQGNVLDFVAAMEQCSVREAALKLQQWFSISGDVSGQRSPVTKTAASKFEPVESGGEAAAENKPLTFQLKGVDPSHVYISDRGIRKETAELFGVGYFAGKGSMSGRVVIPIHNERGELIAYAGRAIDGTQPKYKFPAGFHKSIELFNLHRAVECDKQAGTGVVVLVEGFFDCLNVHQASWPCAALMGCSMSERQANDLADYFTGVILMLDGDEAGRQATDECLVKLGRRGLWVKAVLLEEGKQPDMLSADELLELLK